jgi:hypothetical protein
LVHSRRIGTLFAVMTATVLAGLGFVVPSQAGASTKHGSTKHGSTHHGTASHVTHAKLTFAPASAPLSPPAIPPSGKAYLGAWVQPNASPGPYSGSAKVESEQAEMGEFQAQFGRPLGMVHVYQDWDEPVSNSLLDAISSSGAVPIVDWDCRSGVAGGNGSTVAIDSGTFNTLIRAFATQLKAYGKPVFLRWLWEPNLDQDGSTAGCLHQVGNTLAQDGANYVTAWKIIWNIFKGAGGVGATNVSFVWNPGLAGNISPAVLGDFWPGYQYVDWIGIDGYSRPSAQQGQCVPANAGFAQMFAATTTGCGNLYGTLSGSSFAGSGPAGSATLPIMIGETGATNPASNPNHQREFLEGSSGSILSEFQANDFPDIKAINYYDGTNPNLGDNATWTLAPSVVSGGAAPAGFDAFGILGASNIFSFLDPG